MGHAKHQAIVPCMRCMGIEMRLSSVHKQHMHSTIMAQAPVNSMHAYIHARLQIPVPDFSVCLVSVLAPAKF